MEKLKNMDQEKIKQALRIFKEYDLASTSLLSKRMKLSWKKAQEIMHELKERGYIGPKNGAKARELFY